MVTLEQIHILEGKINKACDLINVLKKENATLKRVIDSSKTRMEELEQYINQFKNEQVEIESGIMKALKKLDELEDDISESTPAKEPNKTVQPIKDQKNPTATLNPDKKAEAHISASVTDKVKDNNTPDGQIEKSPEKDRILKDNSFEQKEEAELDIF